MGVIIHMDMSYSKDRIRTGDVCRVKLDVEVRMEWSDKIPCDWDDEGNPTDYESGWLMVVLPTKPRVLGNEELLPLYSTHKQS